jgi:hypothetical protein
VTSIDDSRSPTQHSHEPNGPTIREHIVRFIRWAIKARLVAADLDVTPHPRDRLSAIRMIVFAQRGWVGSHLLHP